MKILNFNKLTSTQSKVKELIENNLYKEYTIITTPHQTMGYGRSKTNWYTSPKSHCFSYAQKKDLNYLQILTNLKETLTYFNIQVQLKWPNDILIGNFKVAGVLVEKYLNYNIIGIGINLEKDDWLVYKSIEEMTGKRINKFYFLFIYSKYFLNTKIDFCMHEFVYFNNSVYKIRIYDDNLILNDKDGKDIFISNKEYSYDCLNNEIIRKK